MTNALLTPELAAHFAGPSMTILAARDDRFRAAIARSMSITCDTGTGHIDVFLTSAVWTDFMRAIKPGAVIAVTATHPGTYVSYQAKGAVEAIDPADDCEAARTRLNIERMLTMLGTLGATRRQLTHVFSTDGLVRVRVRPTDIFAQTPGPGAGARIGAVA
ncbi:MAG: hypothetical protein JF571_09340 [Asticcacaulis sp.]|nr:hypothetical protein [Asticcacaulis sp.]